MEGKIIKDIEKKCKEAAILFINGAFEDAAIIYHAVLKINSEHYVALVYSGYISLLCNRLMEAEEYLNQAIKIKPKESQAKGLLAEVLYRKDDFKNAAPLYRSLGRNALAQKLESIELENAEKGKPYRIKNNSNTTIIPFIQTDPLPVIQVTFNEGNNEKKCVGKSANLFIDTGAGEIILDNDLAIELGIKNLGSEKGAFGGGKEGQISHGRLNTMKIGNFTVNNIPVNMMQIRGPIESVFGGLKIDGVIGTVFLYHFLSTIDYKKGRLILRALSEVTQGNSEQKAANLDQKDESLEPIEKNTETVKENSVQKTAHNNSYIVPFYMADNHYMVARGKLNQKTPIMYFVDTGLESHAFTCPKSVVDAAGIKLDRSKARKDIGGGGNYNSIPFEIDTLSLGDYERCNLHGLFGPFPTQFENAFGFTINGLISHEFFRNCALTMDFKDMRYTMNNE
jgi:tetratricopeptide (TPR) repeat protein